MKSSRGFLISLLALSLLCACGKPGALPAPQPQTVDPQAPFLPNNEPRIETPKPAEEPGEDLPSADAVKREWQFACTQNGMILGFDSKSGPDHLARPLIIYDQEIPNPIDPRLPGEEMEAFTKVVPVSATQKELVFYAYGRPIRRPKFLAALLAHFAGADGKAGSFFEVHVDLAKSVGVATPFAGEIPEISPRNLGEEPGEIILGGLPSEITAHETIERVDSPSGWVLTLGELEIKSEKEDRHVAYPTEVFDRFTKNPHATNKPVFEGLWAGTNEAYVSLTGKLGQIVFRLSAGGIWSRLTDDHCDTPILGIETVSARLAPAAD